MVSATDLPKEHLPRKTKIAFSFGSLANALLSGTVYTSITFYFNNKLGMDGELLGIAWLLFGVWNAINDPILGWIMDNSKSKLGRRIPFIRYGAPIYGLTFILCWLPLVPFGDQWALFAYFLIVLMTFDTLYSIVGTCYFALPNEMAITARERASISLYSTVIGIAGMILQFTVPTVLLTGGMGDIHPLFLPVMLGFGMGSILVLWITSYFLKENKFALLQEKESFTDSLKTTLKNKPFFIFMIVSFSMTLFMTVLTSGILYYIDYVIAGQVYLNLQNDLNIVLIISLAIPAALGFITGILINLKKINTWGPKKMLVINFSALSIGFVLFFFTGREIQSSIIPFAILTFGAAGGIVSFPALMGDVIDNDEIITGRRREGVYGGFNALITKPAISIANFAFLGIIDAFGFLRPIEVAGVTIKQPQGDFAITGILFSMAILPAIGLIISVIAMRWYPLQGPKWMKQKLAIIKSHEQKQAEYEKSLLARMNKNPDLK